MPSIAILAALPKNDVWIDDFERASVGGSYRTGRGALDISGGQLRTNNSATYNDLYPLMPINSDNGWMLIKLAQGWSNTSDFPFLYWRVQSSASARYVLYYHNSNLARFELQTQTGDSGSGSGLGTTATLSPALADGDTFGIVWNLSSTSFTLRGFRNPTATRPVSSANWDSGDTPYFTMTPNTGPSSGKFVGFGGYPVSANHILYEWARFGSL